MTLPSLSCSSIPIPYVTFIGSFLVKIAVPEYFRLSEWQYDLKKYDVDEDHGKVKEFIKNKKQQTP